LTLTYAEAEDAPESGVASGGVIVTGIPAARERDAVRRMLADRVQFHFFAHESRLRDFEGQGGVQVFYRPAAERETAAPGEIRTASSNLKATFLARDGSAESVSQWGGFVYQDGSRTATAGRGDYDAVRNSMTLRDSPKITDTSGVTTGETASPTVVTAALMQYWTEESRVRYTGRVQLLAESSQLQGEALEIVRGGETVQADGSVKHLVLNRPGGKPAAPAKGPDSGGKAGATAAPTVVKSDRLKYVQAERAVHYSGSVVLTSADAAISAQSIDAVFDSAGRQIERAHARQDVIIRQGGRVVKGETADYDLSPGKFVVVGSPAEIQDPMRGKSAARRLTFYRADDRILLENR
jgi:lipopolysaccharide export system protein LptA